MQPTTQVPTAKLPSTTLPLTLSHCLPAHAPPAHSPNQCTPTHCRSHACLPLPASVLLPAEPEDAEDDTVLHRLCPTYAQVGQGLG